MLIKTTAQGKIAKLKGRFRIVQGGTSSSKTFSIIPLLIDYAIKNPKSEISIVSESLPHLKRGAIRDFLKIMDWIGLYDDNKWNRSSSIYTFDNKSYIEFFSCDSADKLRGDRRDILFVNEANNVDFESFNQLSIRTRKFVYLDFNPSEEFYAHTELMNDSDSSFIILTYKDNEALEKTIVKDIEKMEEKAKTSTYWANRWRVYGLGLIGLIEGVIFDNWSLCDDIPEQAQYLGSGLDFGFSSDPTCLIELYRFNQELYIQEGFYEKGLHNSDIVKRIKQRFNNNLIVADCADPKSISEISMNGINILPCTKGADSIKFGIDLLQQHKINITKDSLNVIKEFRNYKWVVDINGKNTGVAIDAFNHTIDSIRYIATHTLVKNKFSRKAKTF